MIEVQLKLLREMCVYTLYKFDSDPTSGLILQRITLQSTVVLKYLKNNKLDDKRFNFTTSEVILSPPLPLKTCVRHNYTKTIL